MSLILDALNRSDRERPEGNPVPGLQTAHGPQATPFTARWRNGGILIIVLLVLLVVYLVSRSPTPDAVMISGSSPDSTSAPPQRAASVPTAVLVEKVPTAVLVEKVPTAIPVEQAPALESNDAASDDVASLYAGAGQAPRVGRVPPSLDAEPTTGDVRGVSPAPEEPALDVDAITAAARLEMAAPEYEESTIPLVNELDQRTRDEIPSLFFTAHTWSPNSGDSVVTLNGKLHQEGDNVAAGVTLVAIGENTIVLDFHGTQFRLRSLNSWVNL